MTVYVDEITNYGAKGNWCHMMTDSDDIEELHALASKIGMKRSWFQNPPLHPHYDLRPSMRAKAIKAGAVEVGGLELVKRCSKMFKGKEADDHE